jgi:hypothetical protein
MYNSCRSSSQSSCSCRRGQARTRPERMAAMAGAAFITPATVAKWDDSKRASFSAHVAAKVWPSRFPQGPECPLRALGSSSDAAPRQHTSRVSRPCAHGVMWQEKQAGFEPDPLRTTCEYGECALVVQSEHAVHAFACKQPQKLPGRDQQRLLPGIVYSTRRQSSEERVQPRSAGCPIHHPHADTQRKHR